RDVDGGALRRLAAGGERLRLGVKLARALVPTFADDAGALDDDATDVGIGSRGVAPTLGERQRPRHEDMVFGGENRDSPHFQCPLISLWKTGNGDCPGFHLSLTSRIASRKSSTSEKLR